VAKSESQLYKPADACRMAEVAPYVLRYWETEFPALSEGKERGSARLYTARDVQIIARIRQLLYDEGFTVAGAKKRLEAEIQEGRFDDGVKPTRDPVSVADATLALAPPRPTPPVSTAPAAVAPAREASGFPERKAVIQELKEIVRQLEKSRKR
jgi:DNA-binding transcriptional MerR regulator